MRATELFVIGDSHANFWNGTGNHEDYDSIPGIRSQTIPGGLAYSLLRDDSETNARNLVLASIHTLAAEDFGGWIMLYFGANDCNGWIWRQVQHVPLGDAVSAVVDRYIAFILEARAIYPKIAVFGPPATTKSPLFLGDVGTEPERNLAILLFTSMLGERLAALDVPCMSMAREMIAEDGRTRGELFWDCNHASQAMMPYALSIVNATLGLALQPAPEPIPIREYRIRRFETIDTCDMFDKTWLRFVLCEGAQFVTEIGLWPTTFAELGHIDIVTSLDRYTYIAMSYDYAAEAVSAGARCFVPIGQFARNVLIASPTRAITPLDVDIFKRGSAIAETASYSRASLYALHDRILRERTTPLRCVTETLAAPPDRKRKRALR